MPSGPSIDKAYDRVHSYSLTKQYVVQDKEERVWKAKQIEQWTGRRVTGYTG